MKLIAKIGAMLVVAAVCLFVWVYAASEAHLRSFSSPAVFSLAVPDDDESIGRGEHLARTRGCFGCHGKDLAGEVMWGFAVAPNLPALARNESAATLEAAIRHGIGRDGRALYAMPSYNFLHMRDEDLADLLSYLGSMPAVEKSLPAARLPWTIRWDIARGADAAIPAFLHLVPPLRNADNVDTALARGEYLAMTTCNECHGFSLRADTPWDDAGAAPDLVIVAAYDDLAFRTLMKSGVALGGRELEMMSDVARSRFAHFTEQEISDLYVFLSDMSARATVGSAKD